jgi:uncharacterized protein Smg (DUF494 family)
MKEEYLDARFDNRISPGHERIMEILVYLLDEMRKQNDRIALELGDIDLTQLSARGFTQNEISTAFSWLFDKIAVAGKDQLPLSVTLSEDMQLATHQSRSREHSFRVYHEIERNVLTTGAQGYLLQLRELGLMTDTEMELLIDRILMSGVQSLGTPEIRELAAGVIFDFEDASRMGSRMMLNISDTVQ